MNAEPDDDMNGDDEFVFDDAAKDSTNDALFDAVSGSDDGPYDDAFENAFRDLFPEVRDEVLLELGCAVDVDGGMVDPSWRSARVSARAEGVLRGLVELQQSFFDDDDAVRGAARVGALRVLRQAYSGDQHEHAWTEFTSRNPVDRIVQRCLVVKDPDRPEPWWSKVGYQLVVRRTAIAASFCAALGTSLLAAFGHTAAAVPLLFLAASIDIVEGGFARSVHMRDAGLRWLSCVASHVGDLLLLGGVAVYAAHAHHPLWGGAILGAMLLSLLGSFVRVSAMQAGYRFWRSRSVRFARYVGFLAYLLVANVGQLALGVIILVAVCGASGLVEVLHVVRGVSRMPAVQGSGIVFVDQDNVLQAWSLAEDDPEERWTDVEDHRSPWRPLAGHGHSRQNV